MSYLKNYTVWNTEHKVEKEMLAKSLQDLLSKVQAEYGFDSTDIKLVLNEDGTEVDDEEYFNFIPSGTTFQILQPSETWTSIHLFQLSGDVPDGPSVMSGDVQGRPTENVSQELLVLLSRIKDDLLKCLALSEYNLKEIIKMPVCDLASILEDSQQFASKFQDACEMELISREDNDDMLELLRMISEHRNESVKRRKIDNTNSDN